MPALSTSLLFSLLRVHTPSASPTAPVLFRFWLPKANMACFLRHLVFFVVAAMVLALLAGANGDELPPGIMSIHNDFPSKLYVQCDSDREHQGVDMVWPQEAHRFNFYPDMHNYWICTIKTTPMTEFPYTPVPAVWGKFAVYVRNPAFRACYPICVWIANADGLALIIHAGDKPTHMYSWSKQRNL